MLLIGYTHGDQVRATAVRGGAPQSRVPVVLPDLVWTGRCPTTRPSARTGTGASATAAFFRKLFQDTVARCIAEGLVGGEAFAVDASMIKADANRQRSTPGDDWRPPDDPGRAVREYLSVLDD